MAATSTLLCIHRDPTQLNLLKEKGYGLITRSAARLTWPRVRPLTSKHPGQFHVVNKHDDGKLRSDLLDFIGHNGAIQKAQVVLENDCYPLIATSSAANHRFQWLRLFLRLLSEFGTNEQNQQE
jgi:hypothetical protein